MPVQVREQLKQFVIENFLFGQQTDLRDDESFLESGIIDSTGVLELIMFLEEGFGIKVQDSELVPENLDSLLQGSANIWFQEDMNLEVTVQIDASCSHYFKRRTMYPTQKIIEEREDGSIIVSFKVGRYEAIQNMLKSWIPHILILKPEGLKEAVLTDVKRWMEEQQKVAE